jgi:glycine/D-amino acid oxidase-like deaminating enzyme
MAATISFPSRSLTPAAAPRGWWYETAIRGEAELPPLTTPAAADVCIVGGGFTGLWTALELKRRRPATEVMVIEADRCGAGASGRNGGFAMTWWSKFASLVKLCGREQARELAERSEAAVRDIGSFCVEHAPDADFRPCGWVWAATNTAQTDAWAATLAALDAADAAPYEPLTREQVAQRTGSPVHLAGVFEAGVATVQPAALARALTRAAVAAGVTIHEHTALRELRGGSPLQLVTEYGVVRAEHVVLAINAWAGAIPEIEPGLVIVSSDIVATAPIPDELEAIGWRHGPAVSDSRRLVNYYRTSADGRVVFGKGGGAVARGGRIGPGFHGESPRADEVAAQLRFVYPMLWQAPIVQSWRGPIDYSVSGLPFLHRLREMPAAIVATGFSGNGVGPARLAGELLAEMVLSGGDAGLPPALTAPPDAGLPPEPIRYLGARLVRGAIARKEAREDLGRRADPLTERLAELDPTGFVDTSAPPAPPPPDPKGPPDDDDSRHHPPLAHRRPLDRRRGPDDDRALDVGAADPR